MGRVKERISYLNALKETASSRLAFRFASCD